MTIKIGSFFHSGKPTTWQGRVLKVWPSETFVELFSWANREPNGERWVDITDTSGWAFFDSEDDWLHAGSWLASPLNKEQAHIALRSIEDDSRWSSVRARGLDRIATYLADLGLAVLVFGDGDFPERVDITAAGSKMLGLK